MLDFEVIHVFSPMFGVFIAFNKECIHNAIGFAPLPENYSGATDVAVEFRGSISYIRSISPR